MLDVRELEEKIERMKALGLDERSGVVVKLEKKGDTDRVFSIRDLKMSSNPRRVELVVEDDD